MIINKFNLILNNYIFNKYSKIANIKDIASKTFNILKNNE